MDQTIVINSHNLVRQYIAREDRKNSVFVFQDSPYKDVYIITENEHETNEIFIVKMIDTPIRDFCSLIERTSYTSNRVLHSDYTIIQTIVSSLRKTVCYYVVYSNVDRRFKDIIAITFPISPSLSPSHSDDGSQGR
jgi:hypothetical protein